MLRRIGSVFLAGVVALGCSSNAADDAADDEGQGSAKSDQINSFDDPGSLVSGAKTLLKDNITAADVGKTFGTDDAHVPYPDTYWPFVDEGIDFDWTGDGSPLSKYMAIFDAKKLDDAKKWEKANHGSQVPDVASWFGHCPGWTGSALTTAPLKHAINVKGDGNGGVTTCAAGSEGCLKLEIGDINALQAEVFVDGDSAFIGARCDTAPKDIKRDRNGRIKRDANGAGCKGLNPGALLIVAGNVMKTKHQAFAIDAQSDFNTDQIWNQPAYRYKVNRFEPLNESEAANEVVHGTKTGERKRYTWNSDAEGWVLVDFTILWVTEHGPNMEPFDGTRSTREMRMVAVIELDRAASDDKARIIGGEYVDDPTVGATRLTVPPFVWMARGAGPDRLPQSADGNNHNPFVRPSLVAKLVELAQK